MQNRSKRFVAIAVFTAVLVVLVNLTWWFFYRRTADLLENQLERRLSALASVAVGSLSPETIEGLVFEDPVAFLEAASTLERIRSADSLAEVFLLDQNYRYLASTALNPDTTYFLTELNGRYIDSVIFSGLSEPVVSSSYKTGSVYLKSAFAGVYDTDGILSAVLGLEANVDYFDSLTQLRRNLQYSTALSLIGSLVLGLLFLGLQRRINRAEEQLFLSQTERYLGRMVSVVAHELRNPLMIVRGSAERLRKKTDSAESQYIVEEVDRLNEIVTGYLEFARTRGSMLAAEHRETITLPEFVDSLTRHVVEKYPGKTIDWLPSEIPNVNLTGYRRSLRQVMLNLFINGLEACEDAGRPISVGIAAREEGDSVVFDIIDRGPGIAKGDLKRLFDPFFTTKQAGSGLGLYVSRRIIEEMGGVLSAESTLGEGTRMNIRIPRQVKE